MADKTIRYIFLLSALLIAVAYFAGTATDVNAFGSNITKLVFAVTGRDSSGNFGAYPNNGPANYGSA